MRWMICVLLVVLGCSSPTEPPCQDFRVRFFGIGPEVGDGLEVGFQLVSGCDRGELTTSNGTIQPAIVTRGETMVRWRIMTRSGMATVKANGREVASVDFRSGADLGVRAGDVVDLAPEHLRIDH